MTTTITTAHVYAVLELEEKDLPREVARLVAEAARYSVAEDEVNMVAEAAVQLGIIEDVEDTGPEALVREQVEELAGGKYQLRTGYVKVVYAGKEGPEFDLPRYLADLAAGDENSTDYGRLVFSAHGWHAGGPRVQEHGAFVLAQPDEAGQHFAVGVPYHEHLVHVMAGSALEAAQKAGDPGQGHDFQAGEFRVYAVQDLEAASLTLAGTFELDENGDEFGEPKPGTLGAVEGPF